MGTDANSLETKYYEKKYIFLLRVYQDVHNAKIVIKLNVYELRQKQYSAFSNEISDSTKNYGYTCSWQMRELKSKDISFLKSGCLVVAHILAELHISYISFTISS